MLESIGLAPTVESVYRAMLAHRDWSVRQIAADLNLSDNAVKAALDELAVLTLLAPAEADGCGFRPISPALGLTRLIAHAEAEIEERRRELESARTAMAELAAEAADGAGHEGFMRLEGVDAVRERMEQLALTVQFECLSMNPVAAQSPTAKVASKPLNQMLLERDVAVRCIYQQSFTNDAGLVDYAQWLTSIGARVRTVPIVPTIMVIYDRKGVLVPIDPADSKLGAIDVAGPGIVSLALTLFEQMWQSAVPFGEAAPRDVEGLSPTERQLLSLLSDGHTDEVVARRLGVSLSTVRRHMAALMERLSARSRFQAGVRAVECGWLGQQRGRHA